MKNVFKAIWDVVLTLAAYATLTIIALVLIVLTPVVCVIDALQNEIKLSEALSNFTHEFAKKFYEAINE